MLFWLILIRFRFVPGVCERLTGTSLAEENQISASQVMNCCISSPSRLTFLGFRKSRKLFTLYFVSLISWLIKEFSKIKGSGSQTEAERCGVQIQLMKAQMDNSHPLETCTSLVRGCSKTVTLERSSQLTSPGICISRSIGQQRSSFQVLSCIPQ